MHPPAGGQRGPTNGLRISGANGGQRRGPTNGLRIGANGGQRRGPTNGLRTTDSGSGDAPTGRGPTGANERATDFGGQRGPTTGANERATDWGQRGPTSAQRIRDPAIHPPALEEIYRTLKLYQLFREYFDGDGGRKGGWWEVDWAEIKHFPLSSFFFKTLIS